jgi:hypothetical protein
MNFLAGQPIKVKQPRGRSSGNKKTNSSSAPAHLTRGARLQQRNARKEAQPQPVLESAEIVASPLSLQVPPPSETTLVLDSESLQEDVVIENSCASDVLILSETDDPTGAELDSRCCDPILSSDDDMDMGDEVSSRSPLFCGAVHDDSLPQRFVNVRCESRCELLLKSVEPCAEIGLGTADTVLSEGKLADRVVDEGKHGRTVSFSDTVVLGDNTLGQMSSMAQTCVRTQDFAPTEAILRSAKTVRDVLHEQDGAMPSFAVLAAM